MGSNVAKSPHPLFGEDPRVKQMLSEMSPANRKSGEEIVRVLDTMDPATRNVAVRMLQNKIDGLPLNEGIEVVDDEGGAFLVKAAETIAAVREWTALPDLPMGKPVGSAYYKLKDAFQNLKVIDGTDDKRPNAWFFKDDPHIILVEHDWSRAFSGATDFEAGAFRLPFPNCCFEFVLGGKRVCALVKERDEGTSMRPFICHKDLWVAGLQYDLHDDQWDLTGGGFLKQHEHLAAVISEQIRAISIVLEAGAFEARKVDPSPKLNKARMKRGEMPLLAHHVLTISPERVARRERTHEGHDPKWRTRLHFRRGHWRRYETHKTWVRWTMVGNPDLGFVDTSYRI